MLSQKLALVSGASSGIGRELCRLLVEDGWKVVAVARRKQRLDELATELGPSLAPFAADLSEPAQREAVVSFAQSLGPVDLLVNNAGYGSWGHFAQLPLTGELGIVRLNVEALVHLSHLVLPEMLARRTGAIMNVGSQQGFQPIPFFATYNASKAFVLHFTENLSEELRGTGVRALVVCPGPVQTEWVDIAGDQEVHGNIPVLTARQVAVAALAAYKSGRVVKIVGKVNYLLSSLPRFLPRFLVRRISASSARPSGSTD